ncbi:MAG: nucleotidyltransferase family protein [bacterium]|nr:nucleotidyltransferase family protein [bacterium]
MDRKLSFEVETETIAEFCSRNHIQKLSFFGSVLRDDFRPDSDIDVLVEFRDGHVPGLIRLAGMELELSDLLGGRRVDMNTAKCLSPYFRDRVILEAEVQYVSP